MVIGKDLKICFFFLEYARWQKYKYKIEAIMVWIIYTLENFLHFNDIIIDAHAMLRLFAFVYLKTGNRFLLLWSAIF